jgi:hypothetical protein
VRFRAERNLHNGDEPIDNNFILEQKLFVRFRVMTKNGVYNFAIANEEVTI